MLTVDEIRSWPEGDGWHVSPKGQRVALGNGVALGADVTLGNGVRLGDGVKLGDEVRLGNYVTLGDGVTLGSYVTLGDGVTSHALNEQFRQTYLRQPNHIFTKWVTHNRMSPNFDGGIPLHYEQGKTVEEPKAVISDRQCDIGLHVLRYGYRPEWCGLTGSDHNLIAIDVEVQSEDIMFAGLPTMDAKVRVKRLKVLT